MSPTPCRCDLAQATMLSRERKWEGEFPNNLVSSYKSLLGQGD